MHATAADNTEPFTSGLHVENEEGKGPHTVQSNSGIGASSAEQNVGEGEARPIPPQPHSGVRKPQAARSAGYSVVRFAPFFTALP